MATLILDFDSDVPLYRQVADGLRALIADGRFAPGEALPGVRRLGRTLGVNLNTVAKAYRLLAADGLVDLRRGAAARVIGPGAKALAVDAEDARRLEAALARIVLAGVERPVIETLVGGILDRFEAGRVADTSDASDPGGPE